MKARSLRDENIPWTKELENAVHCIPFYRCTTHIKLLEALRRPTYFLSELGFTSLFFPFLGKKHQHPAEMFP